MTQEEARRHVLARAKERGVAAEVLTEKGRELTARSHARKLEQITQAVRGGIGVRVVDNGHVGYAYSEELTAEALDWMLKEAIDNSALQTETSGFLPKNTPIARKDMLGDGLRGSLEAKVQMAIGFEGTLREDRRVKQVLFASYSEREMDVAVASTEGADGSYRRGIAGLMASMVLAEGDSRKQGWDDEWATSVASLEPGRTALEFTERTGRLLGAKPLTTGRYRAYIEPKAFSALLGAFVPFWNSKNVVERKSPFAGRVGETIASSIVTIVDDPTLPDGLAARPIDAEGTPGRRTVLVENGVLKGFLTNSETARQLSVENTGHAWRSYRGTVSVGPTNFFLTPRSGIALSEGVIVAELSGLHAGTNAVTGDFSVQALGLKIEDGRIAYPVEDFAIAGNFLTLLKEITALGNQLTWDYGYGAAYGTPMVEVRELSFAGA